MNPIPPQSETPLIVEPTPTAPDILPTTPAPVTATPPHNSILKIVVIVGIVITIIIAVLISFLIFRVKKVKKYTTLATPTPIAVDQKQKNTDLALQVAIELNKDLDPNVSLVPYSEGGLTISIPSYWKRIQDPQGQVFTNSINSVIIAIHAGGKQCFPTLVSFTSGIQSLGGYGISSQTETIVKGVVVYDVTAKINDTKGNALNVRTLLFKGQINNYEVGILTDPTLPAPKDLISKIVSSASISENSLTTQALACN